MHRDWLACLHLLIGGQVFNFQFVDMEKCEVFQSLNIDRSVETETDLFIIYHVSHDFIKY